MLFGNVNVFSMSSVLKYFQMDGAGHPESKRQFNLLLFVIFFSIFPYSQYNQFSGLKKMFPYGGGDSNLFFNDFGQACFPNWNPSFPAQLERNARNQGNYNFGSQPYYQPNNQYSNYYYVFTNEDFGPNRPNMTGSPAPHPLTVDQVLAKEEHQPQMPQRDDREDNLPVVQEKWRQKFGRNIMSNIFHMTLKKITSRQFSQHTKEAILRNRLVIKVEEFVTKLEEKGTLINSYISSKNMKKLLVGNPIGATKVDIDFRKLLRVLTGIYLHYYHIPHIYHSGKIKKESRRLHLQSLRKLTKRLNKL